MVITDPGLWTPFLEVKIPADRKVLPGEIRGVLGGGWR